MSNRSPERIEFLNDVFVTGIETGYEWFLWSQYDYGPDDPSKAQATCTVLNDDEITYGDKEHVVTLDTIARGIRLILEAEEYKGTGFRKRIALCDRENDCDLDAIDCDTIIQWGVLGEERFA